MDPTFTKDEERIVSPDPPIYRPVGYKVTVSEDDGRKENVMTELEKVLKYHAEQVASGYTCVDKKSKYAKDIDDHADEWDWYNGNKWGFDWCTCYFDDVMINALGVDRARKALNRPKHSLGAGVRYSREYLKSIGRVGDEPRVGCAVYFGTLPYPHHIGFVYKVTDTMIYTYEGNCYVAKGVSGVKARSYKRTYSDILDYGYPVYDESPDPDPKEMDGYKVGNTYEVACSDPLMIRKGPGTSFGKIGALEKGDQIVCIGLAHDQSLNTWLQFDRGWACGKYGDARYIVEPKTIGWIKDGGLWYYYDESGNLVKNDWLKWKGKWYYLGPDGSMLLGWQEINGKKYYFYDSENDGHMASNEWIDGLWLNKSGSQTYPYKGSWKKNDKGRWYEDESGWYPREETQKIDKIVYVFDQKGYLVE